MTPASDKSRILEDGLICSADDGARYAFVDTLKAFVGASSSL
jgi:hypothetical protein